jgi:hypothetical protein
MSFPVNSISQANPESETFASMSRMDRLVAACDYMRNSVPTPGDQAPLIEENPPPVGVKALAAILVAMNGGGFVDDAEYEKLLNDERERIAKEKESDLVLAARWYTLFDVPERGDMTPAIFKNHPNILKNFPEKGVAAMAAILAASEPFEPNSIWAPCTEDDFSYGNHIFWADMNNVGTFDKTASLDALASSMLENRPLTRTELILVLKCNYLAKHRGWAVAHNFKFGSLMRTFRRRCGYKESPCICESIEPNHIYG